MAAHTRRPRIPRWAVVAPLTLMLAAGGVQAWACSATPASATEAVANTTSSDGSSADTSATTTPSVGADTADTTTAQTPADDTGNTSDGDTGNTSDGDAEPTSSPGTSTSSNTANGVTARFTITDTGASMTIDGTATGLDPGSTYVSLIYPANNCSNAVPATDDTTAGQTQAGTWENHGDGSATLSARYDGVAYQAVRGRIGSESVREITAIAPADGTDFSATYKAIDCVPVTPGR